MDRLNQQQSNLLKRISISPISYSSLSADEQAICDFLCDLRYVTYHDVWNPNPDSYIQMALETESVSISESGKMYLINEQLSDEQQKYLKEQIDSLKNIAESAQTQANLAIQTADSASLQAKSAKRNAIFSNIISIISLLASMFPISNWLSCLFNTILQHL